MPRNGRKAGTWLTALCAAALVVACGEEAPPTPVSEFIDNPILLQATMVRCVENRAEARYDSECLNAREAVNRIAAAEEAARRAELDAQSERKRQAVRRAQEAQAEARRRVQEAERRREEAEYLGQFEPLPDEGDERGPSRPDEMPPEETSPDETSTDDEATDQRLRQPSTESREPGTSPPPGAGEPADEAGGVRTDSPVTGQGPDLEGIRRELERRQSETAGQHNP